MVPRAPFLLAVKHTALTLFVCTLAGPVQAAPCTTGAVDRQSRVVHVHDGDTVKLADRQTLRIIGLDTPELARDERPAEPLAGRARDALRALIKENPRVKLQFGRERRDRYDRQLAHLILADGRLAARVLLERGLAALLILPPNIRHADCYAAAQRRAREAGRGIWALPAYRPIEVDEIEPPDIPAYRLVRGAVGERSRSKTAHFIELAGKDTTLKLIIRADERDYFKPVLAELHTGRRIEVQGWINPAREGGYFMRLRHPSALQILPP